MTQLIYCSVLYEQKEDRAEKPEMFWGFKRSNVLNVFVVISVGERWCPGRTTKRGARTGNAVYKGSSVMCEHVCACGCLSTLCLCVCISLSMSISLCMCLSICVSVCIVLSVLICRWPSLCVFSPVTLPVSHCLCLFVWVSRSMSLSMSLCRCLSYVSVFLCRRLPLLLSFYACTKMSIAWIKITPKHIWYVCIFYIARPPAPRPPARPPTRPPAHPPTRPPARPPARPPPPPARPPAHPPDRPIARSPDRPIARSPLLVVPSP